MKKSSYQEALQLVVDTHVRGLLLSDFPKTFMENLKSDGYKKVIHEIKNDPLLKIMESCHVPPQEIKQMFDSSLAKAQDEFRQKFNDTLNLAFPKS